MRLLVTLLSLLLVACIDASQRDYYWREFEGVIPDDAVEGGTDSHGGTTYVGQVYRDKLGLYPGNIYSSGKLRIVQHGVDEHHEANPNANMKILCSNNPSHLDWTPVNEASGCHAVPGGKEEGQMMSIGRVNIGQETIVAKAYLNPTRPTWKGLWAPENGKQKNYKNFEVLTYGCSGYSLDARRKTK